ncbi:hypothetical protein HG536_0G01940 [Torulaspora globosa]|uniref:Mitochondrial presequence protease n=1 Tax=Torulaspora globosa TaxID=48254 RepID=A0A7G3ZLE9_9SACH|nr:uncharacterized protein HG536_0G01940 [Torulaspora globosa]QLL34335.1 hypothetical protein HG536_0G01940 [Torulaspora globosa]
MVFNKLISFQLDYAPQYHLTKYISSRTRLQLVHINHKSSPLVQGYFAVATECATDSGTPHTLEHLIFMGSHQHPFKGLLDTAGNLCMSSTNAWTATDQTVYTLTSAGWKGFKQLLPAYLDHILHPTLTDEACLTEVYHIDPQDLSDKGVVYSEMEAIESQNWFVTMLEKQRLMFKEGSGYRSETGGLTPNLRQLTSEDIRKFHKQSYSADNLCLIISGNIPEGELLEILQRWDDTLPKFELVGRKRPFVDSENSKIPESLSVMSESAVEFPELDESQAELLFSWIGEPYHAYVNDLAATMLMDYFTETVLAPFSKELIEIEEPYANSADYWTDDFSRTIINLGIHGVPTERLEETKQKVLQIMSTHEVDISRMRKVIDNYKWDYVLRCEKNGDTVLSQAVITDFLYGNEDGSSLEKSLKDLSDFDELQKWSQEKWQQFLHRLFVNNKPVIIKGVPSSSMYEQLQKEREELIQKRETVYGVEEKAKLHQLLSSAKSHNSKPIPSSLLKEFTIQDPSDSVNFITTRSITAIENFEHNDAADQVTKDILAQRPKDFPLFLHLEHYPSQFVEVHVLLNTNNIKDCTLLPYYHILEEIFSMPMEVEDGKIIPYEDVVSRLQSETIDSGVSMGLGNSATDLIDIRIRAKAENYAKAVEWIKHCLFDMVFDEKRVAVLLDNYLASIVELKREGDIMLESLTNRKLYSTRSLKKSADPLHVEDVLHQVSEDIRSGRYEQSVRPKIEIVREQLRSNFSKLSFLILGDALKIGPDVFKPWKSLIERFGSISSGQEVKLPPVPKLLDAISSLCKDPREKAFIITTPASESSYMNVITSVPLNMDYRHPDYAIVALASEYLQCVEGPFWKGIRGAGLAYGASVLGIPEANSWAFHIYRGADILKCYQVAKEIVEQHASGAIEIDELLLEGAASMIINRIATKENSYASAAIANFTDNFILKRGPHFNEYHIKRLSEVTIADIRNIIKKYFVNLFDAQKSCVFVSCHPSKLEVTQEFLEKEGFTVEVEELDDEEEEDELEEVSEE